MKLPKEHTLEGLIDGLDQRGLLVLQVLLGQQAMKLLTLDKIKEKTSTILDTNASNIRTISIPT
jgi:hypothetical protein